MHSCAERTQIRYDVCIGRKTGNEHGRRHNAAAGGGLGECSRINTFSLQVKEDPEKGGAEPKTHCPSTPVMENPSYHLGKVLYQCSGLLTIHVTRHQPRVSLQAGLTKARHLRPATVTLCCTLLKEYL